MTSTTTLRNDTARTGTTPDFPINGNPWRKYVSMNLGSSIRAGVLVIENWKFTSGPLTGRTSTLVLATTTDNNVYCFSEGELLSQGSAASPLWHTPLGVTPRMDPYPFSNIEPPLGVCGTPVADTANRRMFVIAMWATGSHVGNGHYSVFELNLDTGTIQHSQELVDPGPAGQVKFDPATVDQRSATNFVDGWLWVTFADLQNFDRGRYYGWVVAINADDLTQQLFQPMISLDSSKNFGVHAGGVWGVGGVAAAPDGTVFALTGNATQLAVTDTSGNSPQDDLTSFGMNYWGASGAASGGPGSLGDYFNAIVHVGVELGGATPQLTVLDWFQASDLTQSENTGDLDFGGSSPVVLPPIDGRQLVAFVPKDGNVFVLDEQNLGNWTPGLTRVPWGDPSNDSKVAVAYMQAPDGTDLLIVAANTQGNAGGLTVFKLDATVNPPTLTKQWHSAAPTLRDSFGSPTVIANPVPDPTNPPNPVALIWVVDGDDPPNTRYQDNVAVRAFDVFSGAAVYDSTVHGDVSESIPHFTPITAGANSVFIPTSTGFMGFTQFVVPAKSMTFVVESSSFGKDEVDALEPTPTSVAQFPSSYWIVVSGVLPGDLGVTATNLVPNGSPTVTSSLDQTLPKPVADAITAMLTAGTFTGSVIPENAAVPDEPQAFMFPYTVSFKGDAGFAQMAANNPPITSTIVTLKASFTASGTPLPNATTQIELTTGENPKFQHVDPHDPSEPTWLGFDLRLFSVTPHSIRFGAHTPSDAGGAPDFIKQVITNLNANNGDVGGDSFDKLSILEEKSKLEWKQKNNSGELVFNYALARVRLLGKTAGPTPTPVRVFFRLFQAQNTVSKFNTATTYQESADTTVEPDHKIPLLGVQNNEYVTIPCFASPRINLTGPADMKKQTDPPNRYPITIKTPGVEVDSYFGCWIDNNQPDQKFLPAAPPAAAEGGPDGPWTTQWAHHPPSLQSVFTAITTAPHQCLIAEISYDTAPVIAGEDTGTSDKLTQRNIAWIDGPNPGLVESRRMPHPVQVWPTPRAAQNLDELMIFWDATPAASTAQLYLPTVDAAQITDLANALRSWQNTWLVDAHTVGFDASGVTFVPLPNGTAPLAGLLTVTLPAGIRRGDSYRITVRQLTDKVIASSPPPPPPQAQVVAAKGTRGRGRAATAAAAATPAATSTSAQLSRAVVGAFQFGINIKTKDAILLDEERLLALLLYLQQEMPTGKRWYPVLLRYIDYVKGRVAGFGGDPGTILPSPIGWVPGLPFGPEPHYPRPEPQPEGREYHGKIDGLIFDHFGDFEGFVLETYAGIHVDFFSHEHRVEELAHKAQAERLPVRVTTEHGRHIRRLIIL